MDVLGSRHHAVPIICRHSEGFACLVRTASVRDHEFELGPAFTIEIDCGIDTFILAPDIDTISGRKSRPCLYPAVRMI